MWSSQHTLLKQEILQQGVLVPQHQALIFGPLLTLLETLDGVLHVLDVRFELFDVLSATFTESGLRAPISLLPLLRRSIKLTSSLAIAVARGDEMLHSRACGHPSVSRLGYRRVPGAYSSSHVSPRGRHPLEESRGKKCYPPWTLRALGRLD